jgi:hypothetical protein
MSVRKLKRASMFSIGVGLGFLCVGVFYFMNSPEGSHMEKLGTVFMMYSGIMLGIGFTALIALKST